MEEKILDLASLAPERPEVKFRNGKTYEMRLVDDFTLRDRAKLLRLKAEFERLQKIEVPSEENLCEIETATNAAIQILLLDAPEEEIRQLSDRERAAIMRFFTELCLEEVKKAQVQTQSQTGGILSPDSSKPMEETPSTG